MDQTCRPTICRPTSAINFIIIIMVLFVLQHECWITHTISATQGSTYTQFSTVIASSHTWNTAIQGALGLLNAAKVPGFYTGTHFAYPGGMTRLSWPGWLVKTERVRTGFGVLILIF